MPSDNPGIQQCRLQSQSLEEDNRKPKVTLQNYNTYAVCFDLFSTDCRHLYPPAPHLCHKWLHSQMRTGTVLLL